MKRMHASISSVPYNQLWFPHQVIQQHHFHHCHGMTMQRVERVFLFTNKFENPVKWPFPPSCPLVLLWTFLIRDCRSSQPTTTGPIVVRSSVLLQKSVQKISLIKPKNSPLDKSYIKEKTIIIDYFQWQSTIYRYTRWAFYFFKR